MQEYYNKELEELNNRLKELEMRNHAISRAQSRQGGDLDNAEELAGDIEMLKLKIEQLELDMKSRPKEPEL